MRPITILLLGLALAGCEVESPVYSGEVLRRDGLLYKPNSDKPLTARVKRYHENGQLEILYTAVEGKPLGLKQNWHDSGQLGVRGLYVDGRRQGLFQFWYENGQLKARGTYFLGKRRGLFQTWYENGQLRTEINFINGKSEGLAQLWRENGEAYPSECYKAGEETDMSYCIQDK